MTEDIIYLNGRLLPRSETRLSPFDHGFLYGYGLFETMQSYDGHIFRLDRHLARLRSSARALGLGLALGTAEETHWLESACLSTLEANKLKDARIRLTVTAGEGEMTPNPTTCRAPTILVTARELVPLPDEAYGVGYTAMLCSLRRNSRSPLSRIKSTCYVENILARMEAEDAGCDEAVLLNENCYVAEGSMTNIFLVRESPSPEGRDPARMLVTPSIENGVLPGITREAVLEIAATLSIEVQERQVELRELVEADEAFVTNSILEVMPLTRFEGKPIGPGRPGPVTETLLAEYGRLVQEETR
ncbi:MAG: aminotransferase class IV [Dehalococcoidia bacterium]